MNNPSLLTCPLLLAMAFDAGASDPVLRSDDIVTQQAVIRTDSDARNGRYLDMPRST